MKSTIQLLAIPHGNSHVQHSTVQIRQDWERFEDQNLELFYQRFNRRRAELRCNTSEDVIPSIVDKIE